MPSRSRRSGTRCSSSTRAAGRAGPVLTWRDLAGAPPPLDPLAYHARTGCFLHPAYWPAKLELAHGASYVSFADYLLRELDG